MIPAPAHHQLSFRTHGTRVRVQDLFGTMPVRVKQRPSAEDGRKIRDKEWESLRRSVTGTLLAWGNPVSLTVHGPDRNQRLRFSFPTSFSIPPETPLEHHVLHKDFDLVLIRNILHQGAGIDLSDMKTWVKTSARISLLTIRGLISLKPAPSKGTQFICLGYQNLAAGSECGILYDEVNRLFALSNFGCREDLMNMDGADISRIESRRSECHSFTKEGLKGGGKGVDRWPMFFVQIEVHFGSPWHQRSNTLSAKQSSLLSSIINVLQAMITGFLTEHHFRPPKRYLRTFNALSSETTSPVSQHIESLPLNDPTAQNIVLKCTNDSSVKWRPRIGNNNTDPCHDLNGQIKLPNFSRKESPLVRDDFGGRSRVKQSLRGSTFTSLVVKPTIELPLHSKRTCGTPRLTAGIEISIAREATVEAEASDEEAVAGFSTAVEIQRQTFSDLSDQSDHTNKAADSVKDKNERDSVITWMNPITRVVASINARTGSMVNDQVCLPPGSIVSELPILAQQSMTTFLTRSKPQRCTFDPLRGPKEGSWAERFLKTWENPIFRITEEAIPQIVFDNTCLESKQTLSRNYNRCQAADPATAIRGAFDSFSAKLTKEALQNAIVLAQVDKKFILIKVAVNDEATRGNSVLVLVDQHAADERIRVELLLSELCTRIQPSATQFTSNLGLTSNIVTIRLPKSLSFPITARDRELFEQYAAHFATWGILYDLKVQAKQLAPPKNKIDSTIIVVTLPEAIAERCRVDSKHLIQLLRTEVWKQKENNMNVSKMPEQSADADDRTWIQHKRDYV
ncbi:DNA mismatch repair protein [Ptychographa xylographoides]|nr:DNA mismatch repair protein [Ptychographa xylographoides]